MECIRLYKFWRKITRGPTSWKLSYESNLSLQIPVLHPIHVGFTQIQSYVFPIPVFLDSCVPKGPYNYLWTRTKNRTACKFQPDHFPGIYLFKKYKQFCWFVAVLSVVWTSTAHSCTRMNSWGCVVTKKSCKHVNPAVLQTCKLACRIHIYTQTDILQLKFPS
jgi:hypothetical protein